MAKVKITGHASGSGVITVTAPNTSTDRTITLPDSTGTILDNTSTLDATKLSGTLPALNGASLTGVAGRRNILINGAMNVAQRGTSAAAQGFTVDRTYLGWSGLDEAVTQSQHALTSSDTEVWAKGFRNSYHFTNGNQTSGAGAADRVVIQQLVENQDIANSGWDYTSSSSYITFSFWVKSSVAQNFYGKLQAVQTTSQNYAFETGSLTANTWTKVTKTIPGNSNIVFANNNAHGLTIEFVLFRGTDTTGSMSLNTWAATNNALRVPDVTSTWYTTNNATFEITGLQLEVGSVATDFEHRSYGEELALCQRYFLMYAEGDNSPLGMIDFSTSNFLNLKVSFPVAMRTNPSMACTTATDYYTAYSRDVEDHYQGFTQRNSSPNGACLYSSGGLSGNTAGSAGISFTNHANASLSFSAEL